MLHLRRITIAMMATMLCPSLAWCEPPAGALVNPAAPPQPQRIELPPGEPQVQQVNYWRAAPQANARQQQTGRMATAQLTPPEPAPLELPKWLLPEKVSLKSDSPVEPSGEAVIIDDSTPEQSPGPSPAKVIELAMAKVERAPSRAAALLVVAHELAVEAKTVGDFGDVIDQCHRALDAGAEKATADSLGKLAAWAYNQRGELLAATGDEHAAFEDFQEAIMLDDTCWAALHNRGVTLARYNKQAEALADFNRAVALEPGFATGRFNRGQALSQLGHWQQAADDYTAAIEAMPQEPTLFAARAAALHELGQRTEAVSDYNQAIRLDPNSSVALVGRGNAYAAEGMYEQAAADFQQALALDPRSADAYRSTAWLLATCPMEQFRDGEKAVEAARRLSRLMSPESPLVLDTLAAAHATAGDYARAVTYQQQAIVLASEDDLKRAYRARLALYRLGKPYHTR